VLTQRCRYAPTPSGPAHPGTLLAGLLCWLDARSRGAELLLRLEDVDTARCTPELADEMQRALDWLGLDWDEVTIQSSRRLAHEAALDALAERGLLYPCGCSRSHVRSAGTRAADGGWRYPGTCRERALPASGWRASGEALRLRLPAGRVDCADEGGMALLDDPAAALGDPVLRRRDGAIAYHLAVVVDDANAAITRVVRGRDLAPLTAIQRVLQRALGLSPPTYRHHLLLLEKAGDKLAKLHGAVAWSQLAERASGAEICGQLACAAGLLDTPRAATPRELLPGFAWSQVRSRDQLARWNGSELVFAQASL
jgi:glutamyl-tRNA synthetase/glutamyl-Q tRNA(Asp) synthetase